MNRIKELRIQKGLKQVELAKIIGTSQSSLSGYENGKIEPDQDTLVQLSEFFDVSIDYLLGVSANPAPPSKDDPLKDVQFALFGTHEKIDDAILDDVRAYAKFKLEQWKKQGKI